MDQGYSFFDRRIFGFNVDIATITISIFPESQPFSLQPFGFAELPIVLTVPQTIIGLLLFATKVDPVDEIRAQ